MSDPIPHHAPPRRRGTVIWLAVLLLLDLLLNIGLWYVVPRFKRTFDEFNLQLPWPTLQLMRASDFYCKFWFALAPLQLLPIVGGVVVGRHAFRTPRPGNVFAAVCLFVLAAALLFSAFGLAVPQIKLMEGLSK